jgi:hypothetical protein
MNEPTCLGWKIQTYDQSPQPHHHIHTPFIKIMAIQQSKLDSHIQISSYSFISTLYLWSLKNVFSTKYSCQYIGLSISWQIVDKFILMVNFCNVAVKLKKIIILLEKILDIRVCTLPWYKNQRNILGFLH